jgi:hypothetical protein
LLVGWHYVKQGFGVLLVLAARRGVSFRPAERRALLGHALTGALYAWASPFDPGRRLEEKGVVYTTLAHPGWLEPASRALFLGSLLPLGWFLWCKWQRHRAEQSESTEGRSGWVLFTPLLGFLCSIWAWSVYSSLDPLVRYAIPALHSLQYLYMVWLLKSNEAREREGPPHFEAPLSVRLTKLALLALALGWLLFRGAPPLLDSGLGNLSAARTELGATPYFAVLYTFVNIHHYFMDHVIWRRDNPATRYLRMRGAAEG